jgi:hypothetical protein
MSDRTITIGAALSHRHPLPPVAPLAVRNPLVVSGATDLVVMGPLVAPPAPKRPPDNPLNLPPPPAADDWAYWLRRLAGDCEMLQKGYAGAELAGEAEEWLQEHLRDLRDEAKRLGRGLRVAAPATRAATSVADAVNQIYELELWASGQADGLGTRPTDGGGDATAETDPPPEPQVSESDTPTVEPPPAPPARPFIPLCGWADIFEALNKEAGEARWDAANETHRRRIEGMNDKFGGPIVFTRKKGAQPSVDRDALLDWWRRTRDEFIRKTEDAEAAAEQGATSASLTAGLTHKFGRTGVVAPDLGGHIKGRRPEKK